MNLEATESTRREMLRQPTATEPAGPAARLLFVEDDEAMRRLCLFVLRKAGYSVEAAEDGEAAWDALQAAPFDLLITDHDMPRLTGGDLVRRLRAAGSTLPVILCTGSELKTAWPPGQGSPFAAILRKPYTADELRQNVAAVLRSRRDHGVAAQHPAERVGTAIVKENRSPR